MRLAASPCAWLAVSAVFLCACSGTSESPVARPAQPYTLALVTDGCASFRAIRMAYSGLAMDYSQDAAARLAASASGTLVRAGWKTEKNVMPFVCGAAPADAQPGKSVGVVERAGEASRLRTLPISLHANLLQLPALAQAYRSLLQIPPACGTAMAYPLDTVQSDLMQQRLGATHVLVTSVTGRVDSSEAAGRRALGGIAVEAALAAATMGASLTVAPFAGIGLTEWTFAPGSRYHAVMFDLANRQARALSCGAGTPGSGSVIDPLSSAGAMDSLLQPLLDAPKR